MTTWFGVRSIPFGQVKYIGIAILIAFVGGLVLWGFDWMQHSSIIAFNERIAEGVSQELTNFIVKQLQILQGTGVILRDETMTQDLRKRLLTLTLHQNEYFLSLSVVDKNGQEVFIEDRRVVSPPQLSNRARKSDFLAVKDTGYYLGPVATVEGRAYFTLGKGVYDERGGFLGGIFARVDARALHDMLMQVAEQERNVRVYVTDQGAVIIGHTDFSLVLREKSFAAYPAVRAQVYHEATDRLKPYVSYTGEEVLGIGVPVVFSTVDQKILPTAMKWFVIVEQPFENSTLIIFLWVLLGVAFLVYLIVRSSVFSKWRMHWFGPTFTGQGN